MKEITVLFEGGESRRNAGTACNFMLVTCEELKKAYTEDELEEKFDVGYPSSLEDVAELYAEVLLECDEEEYDEDYGYEELKADIIRQAKAHGIDADSLKFMYD